MKKTSSAYIIVWKFRPKEGLQSDFEKAYGADGDWVKLFKKGKGHIRSELYQNGDGSYLTVDEWESREAFEEFKTQFNQEYQNLDRRLASLTDEELFIGESSRPGEDEIF